MTLIKIGYPFYNFGYFFCAKKTGVRNVKCKINVKLIVIKCKKYLKTFSACVIISVQLEGGIDYER